MGIFTVSGFRGIVGKDFTPEKVWGYIKRFILFSKTDSLLIGRDARPSGKEVVNYIINNAKEEGFNIFDAGIVPTPTLVFGCRLFKLPGVVITASHNPMEWNGIKFVHKEGRFLFQDEVESLKNFSPEFIPAFSTQKKGLVMDIEDLTTKHIKQSLETTGLNKIKNIKVVIDPVNGAGVSASEKLMEILGVEYEIINKTYGDFKRPPEPTPANLNVLHQVVKENKFDIGFALDPDADRLGIVFNSGPLSEEYTFVLSSISLSKKIKKGVACNLSTSRMIDEVARNYHWKVIRTPVGEANVVRKMLDNGINMGGEGNGGVIFSDINNTRDSITGMVSILKLLTEFSSINDILKEIPSFSMKKLKFQYKEEYIDKLTHEFKSTNINREDGIRIDDEDFWIHIRKSNTEPILRIIIEAKNEEILDKMIKKVRKICVE